MRPTRPFVFALWCAGLLAAALAPASAQSDLAPAAAAGAPPAASNAMIAYAADLDLLERRFDVPLSEQRRTRLRTFLESTLAELQAMDLPEAAREARIDRALLIADCERRLRRLTEEEELEQRLRPLLAHAPRLVELCERRRAHEPAPGPRTAADLHQAATQLETLLTQLEAGAFDDVAPHEAKTAVRWLGQLQSALDEWRAFYDGYDPVLSWWAQKPFELCRSRHEQWRQALSRRLVDRGGDASLLGTPIGEEALLAELRAECIPYAPAELVAIAEREFAFCELEGRQASEQLGYDGDWIKALEAVKGRHREPGQQPQLIRDLAQEAIDFLDERALLTIPDLAREGWRMTMMSPEAQKVNPFFLGGETIYVSFPTDAMGHDEKLQSLRSNNEHFCRATVHHELIPGHWLQQHAQERHRPWRSRFATPFWIEGWALYWEMRLYELGFAKSPEDRIGMLYWRKHRCARIVFSLNYHLGRWSPRQCIDYLIEKVGHEPSAAEGEVRRSITGGYGPLYQAAYMLGGLQLLALRQELVGSGAMPERAFHDAVLHQNAIPIALLRLALLPSPLSDDAARNWRFADPR